MSTNIPESKPLNYTVRMLQVIFAGIIIGTDAYAIHTFSGHVERIHYEYGDFDAYYGVPNAWGFLMFCAVWTIVDVMFQLGVGKISKERRVTAYFRVLIETVAVLSWLAGFVAMAVQISTGVCRLRTHSCGPLIAATVFGTLEWLLFVITAYLTFVSTFTSARTIATDRA